MFQAVMVPRTLYVEKQPALVCTRANWISTIYVVDRGIRAMYYLCFSTVTSTLFDDPNRSNWNSPFLLKPLLSHLQSFWLYGTLNPIAMSTLTANPKLYLIAIIGLRITANLQFRWIQNRTWFRTATFLISCVIDFCCQTLATAFSEFARNHTHSTTFFWLFCDSTKIKLVFTTFFTFERIVICHQMISIAMITAAKTARYTRYWHIHTALEGWFKYSFTSTTWVHYLGISIGVFERGYF